MGNLISLTTAKTYLQINNTLSDTLIDLYIDLTESEIGAYTSRNLARNTYTEVTDYMQSKFDQTGYTYVDVGQEAPRLFLKNTPVVAIEAIISGGNTVSSTAYSYNAANGIIESSSQLDEPTVTYVAGYTTITAPADLQLVALQGVKSLFENNNAAKAGSGNVTSKRLKDFSVSYGNAATAYQVQVGTSFLKTYLEANKTVLNKYRRVLI